MHLIDTHSHIHLDVFDKDRDQVIERARQNGVVKIIVLATDLTSSYTVAELSSKYPEVYAAVGIHPCDAHKADKNALSKIQQIAESCNKIIAIGESGLDFYWEKEHYEVQYHLFREQIDLAKHLKLPIVIHTRSAQREMQFFFQEYKIENLNGVMHCFEGDELDAQFYVEMGLHLSFTANITYPGYPHPQIFQKIPLDRIMIETDSPYITPQENRGKRNEPANVLAVAQRLAVLLGKPLEEIADITSANALKFFKISSQ